jgi:3-oxoacyl-[acyl-carrier-protein] synthase-3
VKITSIMKISITGTGSHYPSQIVKNDTFLNHEFLDMDGSAFDAENDIIIEKFKAITGIEERKYADHNLNTSDLGIDASKKAIADAGIDQEELDYIIFAHNFGDIKYGQNQSDTLPSLATRVKHGLGIKNPNCVAYDVLYGCPGWVEGMIQAYAFIKAGMAKKCLVIGGETLSRVVDPHDRDSMIYADGAGATIVEVTEDGGEYLSTGSQTFAFDEAKYLFFGESYNDEATEDQRYIKMYGRKIYEFAVTHVPAAIKSAIDQSGVDILDIKKIFIHQANEKMDDAIIKRLYRLYKMKVPEGVMPMNIQTFGNSSVATVPTLFDLVCKNQLEGHQINKGDVCVFASVGAGMNINAIVYRY